ncbi:MAG: AAA family ATPase [Chromatiales bacterium]|nr:AAA family ATPase [Chromatiales bacterium]
MRPFADSPYFVANPLQANALARLRQAATFPGGVAVLSGGPGVGKSAFVRHALAPADSDVQLLPVDLRNAEAGEFLDSVLDGLGATPTGSTSVVATARLREALLAQRTSGRQLIIALDVAGLNVDLARRLLRFVHLCSEQQTPVSLVLQGPHTLHQLLDVPGLIQLRQRQSFRLKLRPLTLLETSGYLRHCLTASGGNHDDVMAVNAAASVYLYVAGVPRLINTLMDAALGEIRARQGGKIDADLIRQVAEQLGWKPIGSLGPAELVKKPVAPAIQRTADRSGARSPAAEPAPAPPPPADPLPASDITRRLQLGRAPVNPPPAEAPAPAPAAGPRTPAAESRPPPPVPMDDTDTGATGMLRLEDLDERFAETLFSEDSGHFKALIDAGKAD